MRRKISTIGKVLINGGILCILPLPLLPYEEKYEMQIVLFALAITFIGCIMCITANKGKPNNPNNHFQHSLIRLYFRTIKWSLIVAIVFHIIATCVIFFFYWLKRELEATLLITLVAGIAIGLVCEVAIPYYKNYKDKN